MISPGKTTRNDTGRIALRFLRIMKIRSEGNNLAIDETVRILFPDPTRCHTKRGPMSFTSRTNFEAPNILSAYDFIFSLFHPYISFLLDFLINCGGARALDLEAVFSCIEFCSARTHLCRYWSIEIEMWQSSLGKDSCIPRTTTRIHPAGLSAHQFPAYTNHHHPHVSSCPFVIHHSEITGGSHILFYNFGRLF